VRTFSNDDGFTITELLVSTTIMLMVAGATLTTFKNGLDINDTANQMGDANQNLRAGSTQLVRDLMMAGRIIANGGVPAPSGAAAQAIARPGPAGSSLTFSFVADDDGTLLLPAITTGYQLGPTINGSSTDIVTLLTVDEFMPSLTAYGTGTPTGNQAVLAVDGGSMTLPSTSVWLVGDTTLDTTAINAGDIVMFRNAYGTAIQSVTGKDATHIYFAAGDAVNDWFHLNQRSASLAGTINCLKQPIAKVGNQVLPQVTTCDPTLNTNQVVTLPIPAETLAETFPGDTGNVNGNQTMATVGTALLRLQMITYYVDNTTTPGSPRLTRMLNHFAPQALAGVVEDLDLTYDLVDTNSDAVQGLTTLPQTINGVLYSANMIKKVNLHLGVRSEQMSKPMQTYVRNHITTAVGIRSLASMDRYDTGQNPGS
jgi:hypothetical protein